MPTLRLSCFLGQFTLLRQSCRPSAYIWPCHPSPAPSAPAHPPPASRSRAQKRPLSLSAPAQPPFPKFSSSPSNPPQRPVGPRPKATGAPVPVTAFSPAPPSSSGSFRAPIGAAVSPGLGTGSMSHPYQRPVKGKGKEHPHPTLGEFFPQTHSVDKGGKGKGLTYAEMSGGQQKGFKGGKGGKPGKGGKGGKSKKGGPDSSTTSPPVPAPAPHHPSA